MAPLPEYCPKQISLGPLETEILEIIWDLGEATVKQIHDRILADPDRELAYTSVTTVLRRLADKGWLHCQRTERAFLWQALVSRDQAKAIQAHQHLKKFLAVGNPDIVAAFADSLDLATMDQIEAIAQRLKQVRQQQSLPESLQSKSTQSKSTQSHQHQIPPVQEEGK